MSDASVSLAKELDVAFVALHQLNRSVETGDDTWPQRSHFSDSGSIEQDAHVVAFVYRAAYYVERKSAIPKHKKRFSE